MPIGNNYVRMNEENLNLASHTGILALDLRPLAVLWR